jgi:Immunity protein 32
MTMQPYLLSFEFDENAQQLLIHGDSQGLKRLAQIVLSLIGNTKEGHFNHDHLRTPAWAGSELSGENKGGAVIDGVKIYCWKGKHPQT